MKKLVSWIGGRSHLFAKLMVSVCIGSGIYFGDRAFRIAETTGNSAAAELGIMIGFVGGELTCLLLKTIFGEKADRKNKMSKLDTADVIEG